MTSAATPLTLLVIAFDGPVLPDWLRVLLARGLGGVALFARNLVDRAQVSRLNREIRVAARDWPPPLIAVDQEGGRVQRLRRLCPLHPSARDVGRQGPGLAREVGRSMGRDLRGLGFNTDFAPVLDLDTHRDNPIIGDRAFGSTPEDAIPSALAFLQGIREAGIQPCGKHFPGHGDARADSHLELPVIDVPEETLARREMAPFQAAFREGLDLVMTAHCLYPTLDPDLPATLSRRILQGWLRDRLGYRGCVISDDLGMKAISDRYPWDFVVREGLEAGLDLLLHCDADQGEALVEALHRSAENPGVRDRVRESAERVLALRRRLSDPGTEEDPLEDFGT